MSQVLLQARPWVQFDAANKEHRRWYAEYVRTGTWGKCPVRFAVANDPAGALAIQRLILTYYVSKEFPAAMVNTDVSQKQQ